MNLLHALFTRNLLMSTVAIVRYIPRAFWVKQVDGNLFFREEKRQEYRRRVESVTPHSPRQWGTFPEQPVGLRLPAGFKIPPRATFAFDLEKAQLLKILDAAWYAKTADAWKPPPLFGKMTANEWGKLLQIHVDYHLRQFAA
jgi:hypothetical protein